MAWHCKFYLSAGATGNTFKTNITAAAFDLEEDLGSIWIDLFTEILVDLKAIET